MHAYLFSGIAVSLLLNELTGFSPGGIVVAGYLAMFIMQPKWLIGTLVVSIITYCTVEAVRSRTLLYGRRLFTLYILTGILISQLAAELFTIGAVSDFGIFVIGYLIPGLIARDFSRQGIVLTVFWLALAVLLTRLIVLAGEGLAW